MPEVAVLTVAEVDMEALKATMKTVMIAAKRSLNILIPTPMVLITSMRDQVVPLDGSVTDSEVLEVVSSDSLSSMSLE